MNPHILKTAIYKYIFYSNSNNIDNILVSSKILLAYSSPGEIF